ncbi:MAG: twin-arginine translocation pathway signal protein [Piscinibacter sp.]|uniref:tripartite tricarboxylate transporter substrate-binding protein n=1 Tax=Piscinibacter sp. TaxID=1903157 RepID=UPI00258BC714|nr:tripartite tricarboxylate transporter substrate-binding protein [Piscinibacter sp.]MCW5667150.1 twin-arginine translocation pathway signal protein [Piscinibacter sp.]
MSLTRRSALAALATAASPLAARAQAVEQPRILYGFPPGSAGDVVARRVAERLAGSAYAKNAAVVENRAGAGGRLALEALKAAPADGSVLALTPFTATVIYPHVYRRLAYDPLADFAPVAIAALAHHGLAVGPLVPATVTDVKGFVAWARANPDHASYGSPGAGSTPHFLGALLGLGQNLELRHVPYRGSVPGVTELLGGQVAAMLTPAGDFLAHHRSGKLRLLATSGRARLPFAPEVPTFAERGLAELTVEEWFGFYAPAPTPPRLVASASSAINAALKDRSVVDGLAAVGLLAQGSTPEEMARSQRAEHERWGPLVRRVGFTADS